MVNLIGYLKGKVYWDRSKSFSASLAESASVSQLCQWAWSETCHRQPKAIFLELSTQCQGDFCHLEEAANLILSWYYQSSSCQCQWFKLKMTLSWHWTALRCPGIGRTDTLCQCVGVIILTLSLKKTQLTWEAISYYLFKKATAGAFEPFYSEGRRWALLLGWALLG